MLEQPGEKLQGEHRSPSDGSGNRREVVRKGTKEPTIQEVRDSNKIVFWKPFPQQQRVLDFLEAGKKVILLQGANRIGKSVCGVCVLGSFVYGAYPWSGKITMGEKHPTRCRVICFDHETEILTKDGWRNRAGIHIGMDVLTVNPVTRKSEWQPVRKIIDDEGETVHMEGKSFDAVVTPDHRWLVHYQTTGGRYAWKIVQTKNLSVGDGIPLTVEAPEGPGVPDSDDYISLLGWIFSEGSYDKGNRITLYQSEKANHHKCLEIEKLLFSVYGKVQKWVSSSSLASYTITRELGMQIKSRFPNKRPDMDFIVSMTTHQRRLLYESLEIGRAHV
jgi:hypothetical protein